MAGTSTLTKTPLKSPNGKIVEKYTIDWVADAADGSVPNLAIPDMYGFLIKALTNPGAVAPTDNYDIKLLDPDDSAIDALADALLNRDTANSEQVYPIVSGAAVPIFLAGDYTLNITNNLVNSATGQIILYVIESL